MFHCYRAWRENNLVVLESSLLQSVYDVQELAENL